MCKDHFALINELNNVSLNVFDLINSLHTSVINYKAIRKSNKQIDYLQQYFSFEISNSDYLQQSNQDQNDHYFIDHQYRRNKFFYDRRDDYRRDEFCDRSNDRFQSNRRLKRCFVCGKPEC
jgi:hypothetical protein